MFFYNEKFTQEEWRENVTLYAASQGCMLEFKFVLQSVLNLTSLGETLFAIQNKIFYQ